MNKTYNPHGIAPTTGTYSHAIEVPPNSRLLYMCGEVPIRPDGTVPETFDEQAQVVWDNVKAVLEAAGMSLNDVVKMTGYIVRPTDRDAYRDGRNRNLGTARPASTLLVVARLGRPEWLIEIDAVAAKPEKKRAAAQRKPAVRRSRRW